MWFRSGLVVAIRVAGLSDSVEELKRSVEYEMGIVRAVRVSWVLRKL